MESNDLILALMAGNTFDSRAIGLYGSGVQLLEPQHAPPLLCDPSLAHAACFRYSLDQGKTESIHFSIHALCGGAPKEHTLDGWAEMLKLWRRKADGLRPSQEDPRAYLWVSRACPESNDEQASLILDWGMTISLCSLMGASQAHALAARELSTGLLALCAEGWLAVPMGKFEGKNTDHIAPARALARERLGLALALSTTLPAQASPTGLRL